MTQSSRGNEKGHGRVFGLDVLRALAILLVMIGHSSYHHHPPSWFKWFFDEQGTLGVELFYVLSGFLIGHILIRSAKSGKLNGMSDVFDFWKRRWARTLPLYLFFILVYLRFDYLGIGSLTKDYPFFIFMQNFAWPQMPFFQHSWSLAVEEWFYFLFPLTFLWLSISKRSYRGSLLSTCFLFIVVPMIMRAFIVGNVHDYTEFNENIRSIVVCRLDSIFYGVLLALLKIEWRSIYVKLRYASIPAGILIVFFMFYMAAGAPGLIGHPIFMVLFFPLLSITIALTLPGLEKLHTIGNRWLDTFITYTSKISYSLYLGHVCMFTLVDYSLEMLGFKINGSLQTFYVYMAYVMAFYAFATLTYYYIERPYILLRDAYMGHDDERSGNVALIYKS